MQFAWVKTESVDDAVIEKFDSGNYAFNDFLKEKAEEWKSHSESVTYLCVDNDEYAQGKVSIVYGFAAVNTMGLLFESADGKHQYLPCAELRLFAIAKQLRRHGDTGKPWSKIILTTLLQELYFMSMSTIGFKAVFLNSNHDGYQLYKEVGFDEITDYITPDADDKIETDECKPLLLVLTENVIDSLFI